MPCSASHARRRRHCRLELAGLLPRHSYDLLRPECDNLVRGGACASKEYEVSQPQAEKVDTDRQGSGQLPAVLLVTLEGKDAAGWNLQVCFHVILAAPCPESGNLVRGDACASKSLGYPDTCRKGQHRPSGQWSAVSRPACHARQQGRRRVKLADLLSRHLRGPLRTKWKRLVLDPYAWKHLRTPSLFGRSGRCVYMDSLGISPTRCTCTRTSWRDRAPWADRRMRLVTSTESRHDRTLDAVQGGWSQSSALGVLPSLPQRGYHVQA